MAGTTTTRRRALGGLPEAEAWVEIGEVCRAHGLDGSLLVRLHGDDPVNLIRAGSVRLDRNGCTVDLRLLGVREGGSLRDGRARVRVRLEGITSRGEAGPLSGARLSIPRSALRDLPEGEFYWRELIGLSCSTLDGKRIGRIEEIWPTPANDLLVVREGRRDVLVPAVGEILRQVDLDRGTVWIDPPEGLIEDRP